MLEALVEAFGWSDLVVGIVVALISLRWSTNSLRKQRKYEIKRDVVHDLAGARYDLTGDTFSHALNRAAVVFDDCGTVRDAIREFHECVVTSTPERETQRKLLAMLREMFDDLGLDHGELSDDFLLTPFNTRESSTQSRRMEKGE